MTDAPTYTRIPNDIIDAMPTLGNAELRVLLAIARKTVGWQKECDVISTRQIEHMTGLGHRHVLTALDTLLAKGLIDRAPAKRRGFCYRLVTLGDQSPRVTSSPRVPDLVTLGDQSSLDPVPLGDQQKKESKEKKETHGESDPLYGSMFGEVARVCRIDLKLCTKAQRMQVAQTSKALRKAGKLPDEVPKVERWWYLSDWRGKKGDAPRPAQLIEVWPQATAGTKNGEHIRQSLNGHSERGILRETNLDEPL
jgi:phage replication O-like protein O